MYRAAMEHLIAAPAPNPYKPQLPRAVSPAASATGATAGRKDGSFRTNPGGEAVSGSPQRGDGAGHTAGGDAEPTGRARGGIDGRADAGKVGSRPTEEFSEGGTGGGGGGFRAAETSGSATSTDKGANVSPN